MIMKKENYQLIVKTNSYAGNFERELCAYMTGHTGECGVGHELVEADITERFENKIATKSDDSGCYRPVALDETNADNMIIFLEEKLSSDDIDFLTKRAVQFEQTRPYEYLAKDFKFLGLSQVKVTIGISIEKV